MKIAAAALAALTTLGSAFPLSWKLPERVPIVEFIERHRYLSERSSSAPGRYSFDRFPYLREIMGEFTNPEVHWLTIVAASQTGKTTCCENFLFYTAAVDPTPAMWVFASEDLRREFVKERLKPAIDSSPEWKALVSPGQWAVSETQASFVTMPLFYGLAESEPSLSSKPCGLVLCDETGKFPANTTNEGSPIDQARARQRTFPRRKFVDTSTVTTEHDGVWVTFKQSDMREWMVACPKCGERASWERSDIRWEDRPAGVALLDWANRVRSNPDMAWWQCPHCSHKVQGQLAKNEMNAAGKWIGRGYPTDHVGFRIPSLASVYTSFHEYAADLLKSLAALASGDDAPMKHFTIHEDARPWSPKKIVLKEDAIARLVKADMPQGRVPSDARFLTVGSDVQDDCLYAQCWAWSVRAGRVHQHLVDQARVADFGALEREFLERSWPTAEGRPRRADMLFVDSGDNTVEVYRWTNRKRRSRVRPTKGESVSGGGRFWRKGEGDEKSEHRGRLVKLFTEELKDYVALAMEQGRVSFHASVLEDADFQRQMCSEERAEKKDRRGKKRTAWGKRPGYDANHHWDCCIGALGAAVFLGMIRNDHRWRRMLKPSAAAVAASDSEHEPDAASAPPTADQPEPATPPAPSPAQVATAAPTAPKPKAAAPKKRTSLFKRGNGPAWGF